MATRRRERLKNPAAQAPLVKLDRSKREPAPEGMYDFDANGPELDDEDEAILDRIWAQVAAEKGAARDGK